MGDPGPSSPILRIALAAPARGGKATRSTSTHQCRINCLAAVMDPLGELIARIQRQAATDGPRTRAQSRATAPETAAASPPASDRTAAAVRLLLAEVAPGRALQLLTSDGVCDAADPAVLKRLRELRANGSPCKVVAMGVQARVDTLHGRTGWLVLQVDLKNAFNSIARPAILGALERLCPSMMPWVRQAF